MGFVSLPGDGLLEGIKRVFVVFRLFSVLLNKPRDLGDSLLITIRDSQVSELTLPNLNSRTNVDI